MTAVRCIVILMQRGAEMSFNFLISFSCAFTMPKISRFSLSSSSASASNSLASMMTEDSGVGTELSVSSGSSSETYATIPVSFRLVQCRNIHFHPQLGYLLMSPVPWLHLSQAVQLRSRGHQCPIPQ